MTVKALFGRQFALTIGPRLIQTSGDKTLNVDFKVTKTLSKEPNKAEILIHNLKEETRALFQEKNQGVILEAGYVDNTSVIFRGTVTNTDIERVATGWIVDVECTDGGTNVRRSRINQSFRGQVDIKNTLRQAVSSLGIGSGNIADVASNLFNNGMVLSGKTDQQIEKLARKSGTRFSIQDGQATFLTSKQTRRGTVVVLSEDSGLVGTPQIGEKGFVTCTAKIQPNLGPGFGFQLESRQVDGFYRIEKATYRGQSWGDAWIVALEGKPL